MALARGSVLHALKVDDFMCSIQSAPEFLATLNEQSFWGLFNGSRTKLGGRAESALSRAEFRDYNGKMKKCSRQTERTRHEEAV